MLTVFFMMIIFQKLKLFNLMHHPLITIIFNLKNRIVWDTSIAPRGKNRHIHVYILIKKLRIMGLFHFSELLLK